MSTNSNIGYVSKEDGKIHYVYCHWDGYYNGLGADLYNRFTDYDSVVELVEKGDMSYLEEPYTERGEKLNKPRIVDNPKLAYEQSYLYILDDEVWKTFYYSDFITLEDVLEKLD